MYLMRRLLGDGAFWLGAGNGGGFAIGNVPLGAGGGGAGGRVGNIRWVAGGGGGFAIGNFGMGAGGGGFGAESFRFETVGDVVLRFETDGDGVLRFETDGDGVFRLETGGGGGGGGGGLLSSFGLLLSPSPLPSDGTSSAQTVSAVDESFSSPAVTPGTVLDEAIFVTSAMASSS